MNYQLIFSPTGGTERVADLFCGAWGGGWTRVDLSLPGENYAQSTFQREDVCLVAVPSFGGRVPAVALERLGRMSGNGARAVLAAVYGNRAFEDTLLELRDTLKQAGFRCPAAFAAVAEHSIFRQYGTGRPDEQDRQEVTAFAARVKAALEQNPDAPEAVLPGEFPYKEYKGVPLKPAAGKHCTKCGLCSEKCPVGAIPIDAPDATNKDLCISCMRCIAVCPSQARKLNPAMHFAAAQGMKGAFAGRKENTLYIGEEK